MSVKIPSSFDFGINLDLDANVDLDGKLDVNIPTDYGISLKQLPPIEIKPIDFSLRLKEIPSIRAHLPLDYKLGFSLLGRELACIHLCGQGQAITEPYVPYPCEPQPGRKMVADAPPLGEHGKLASDHG
jgi:hypothetical protein